MLPSTSLGQCAPTYILETAAMPTIRTAAAATYIRTEDFPKLLKTRNARVP